MIMTPETCTRGHGFCFGDVAASKIKRIVFMSDVFKKCYAKVAKLIRAMSGWAFVDAEANWLEIKKSVKTKRSAETIALVTKAEVDALVALIKADMGAGVAELTAGALHVFTIDQALSFVRKHDNIRCTSGV